jgi:hypothetical protein
MLQTISMSSKSEEDGDFSHQYSTHLPTGSLSPTYIGVHQLYVSHYGY